MILTIKEYDRLQVREKRNLENYQISSSDAALLQSLVIDDTPVFKWGNRCLVAQQWVGVISLPDFSIEILPKISATMPHNECRDILTRMLLIAHQPSTTKKLPSSIALHKNSLSEVLIATYLTSLELYIKKGLLSSYVKVQSNLDVVKGRIVFSKQFNQNILSPTRFHCAYSKYIKDDPINRFFLCCLNYMQTISRDGDNLRRIRSALTNFDGITSIDANAALSTKIAFNSTNAIAEEAYEYGRMFLTNNFVTLNAGRTTMNVMLFDMNKLYETFIYRCLRHAYGNKVTYQYSKHYLVINPATNRKFINLRPDIVLWYSNTDVIVIDTKWKLPKSFAKESDAHQMNAYSTSIPGVKKVILLYPLTSNTKAFVGDYEFLSGDGQRRPFCIRAVDLSLCLSWSKFLEHIISLFEQ